MRGLYGLIYPGFARLQNKLAVSAEVIIPINAYYFHASKIRCLFMTCRYANSLKTTFKFYT
jgi:hypothetical protein